MLGNGRNSSCDNCLPEINACYNMASEDILLCRGQRERQRSRSVVSLEAQLFIGDSLAHH